MKKLLFLILIITLPLITFFQYKNYKRYHPPVAYEYTISDSLDINYHDYALVEEYYSKAVEIGAFARLNWRNEGIDVRYPDQNNEVAINASKYYNQLLKRVKLLETKLHESYQLKQDGYDNEEIKLIESGMPAHLVKLSAEKDEFVSLSLGDKGQHVWELQKRLINKGYNHNLDGVFGLDTQNRLIAFQRDNGLYPSGRMDEFTFEKLFEN